MTKVTTTVLMLFLTLSGAFCYANNVARTERQKGYGIPIEVNEQIIRSDDSQFITTINNVNGKILHNMTNNLNAGRNLINTGNLKYGLFYGCVNYTSRALAMSGVLNVNAFLPVTAPVLLNLELAIRNIGIYASPYLIQY